MGGAMSSITINGDTSGSVILQAPAVAGSTTLTLPTTSGTVLTTTSGQWITTGSDIYYNTGNVGIGTTPTGNLKLSMLSTSVGTGLPASSGTTPVGNMRISDASNISIDFGSYNVSPYPAWIQVHDKLDQSANYPLALNPNGGAVVISGTSTIAGYKFTMYHTDQSGMAYKYNGTSEQNSCSFQNANGQVGRIYTSNVNTTYSTSSDYRLKENVVPMTGALDKVAQLNPVTYTWKTDGSAGQGFIAHELQAVVPDCVGGTKDAVDEEGNPIYQDIDTSFLVATLTAAIQELTARVQELEAKVGK